MLTDSLAVWHVQHVQHVQRVQCVQVDLNEVCFTKWSLLRLEFLRLYGGRTVPLSSGSNPEDGVGEASAAADLEHLLGQCHADGALAQHLLKNPAATNCKYHPVLTGLMPVVDTAMHTLVPQDVAKDHVSFSLLLTSMLTHLHAAVQPAWFQIANRMLEQASATTKWAPFISSAAAHAFATTRPKYLLSLLKGLCQDLEPVLPKELKLTMTAHPDTSASETVMSAVLATAVTPDFLAALIELDRHAGWLQRSVNLGFLRAAACAERLHVLHMLQCCWADGFLIVSVSDLCQICVRVAGGFGCCFCTFAAFA